MRATVAYDSTGEIIAVAIPGNDIEQGEVEFEPAPGRTTIEIDTDELEGLDQLVEERQEGSPDRQLAGALMTHFQFDAQSGSLSRRP